MRRALALVIVLTASGLWIFVPNSATAVAPTRTLAASGTGVAMYPAFDPAVSRYAATTTAETGGTLQVAASTSDPAGRILVDGRPATGPTTTISGLTAGDEVSVIFDDSNGPSAYSIMYLPVGFPQMSATQTGSVAPGYLGVGLTTFAAGPSFETLLDRNGVPAWVRTGASNDLKRQTSGELTVMRPTIAGAGGFTGYDLLTLDDQFNETARRHVLAPLTDTDNHDSQRLSDGSTILIGYEPRGDCGTGDLDATIQKVDASGNIVFQWSSEGLETETLNPLMWPMNSLCQRTDYAHINSVEEIPDGSHDLLVSFRHFSAVYRISTDPANADPHHIVWRLGGRHSDFSFVDDADNGPCAQHNATWIGPDRVLLFDNGSATLGGSVAGCVDPLNPTTGAGIPRTHTRVSEYLLDTAAGTATLDWSYDPANTFTFFAGSAARLDNGDTLAGWASDRDVLATEVDHAATPAAVWSLAIPGNDPSTGYTSYRVSLVPYTDAIDPTPTLSIPGGAAYVDDHAPATPTWACTDRGGSNLTSCVVHGLVDGHLATTPGTHTISVTATDGAGNTATVTRSYTVASAHQPDGMIRKGGSTSWKGADVYGSASDQTVRQRARSTHTIHATWTVQNDGERADNFLLTGARSTSRWHVRYFVGKTDVTHAVVHGVYLTGQLATGQAVTLRIEVTPTRRARVDQRRTFELQMASTTTTSALDTVATRVRVRR